MNHPIIKMNQSKIDKDKAAARRKHIQAMIEKGLSVSIIQQEVLTYYGVEISPETIRTARKRMNAKKNEPVHPAKKGGSKSGSKSEPAVQIIVSGSNDVLPGSNSGGSNQPARFKIPFHIITLEAGYYVTVATACYGFTLAMPGFIGGSFAIVYGLLSFAALQMVKDSSIPKTAEYGRNLVYILELIACVFAHYYTINRALWANLKALPFEVAYMPKGGIWEVDYAGNRINGEWNNGEVVFNLAVILAVILGGLAVAAISLRLELTKETTKQNDQKTGNK
jgi:hypothetical protein